MKIVIDIVVCIDYTSSIMSYFGEIRKMILSIGTMTLASHGDVRIGLIKFRSCYDRWRTQVHGFISNIDAIEQILTDQDLGGESPDGYKAVGKKNRFLCLKRVIIAENEYYFFDHEMTLKI
ncbi:unnamed protein product [Rotaria sp. Silwood1]|nr:unnamed protein product [Rotaria sp. Silwood1]